MNEALGLPLYSVHLFTNIMVGKKYVYLTYVDNVYITNQLEMEKKCNVAL